jgi:outer membrane lipoprotein carrier protein
LKWFRFLCICGCLWLSAAPSLAQKALTEETLPVTLNGILDRVEARYAVGFSADFSQSSTVKAMNITDTASGKVYVKRPGKMRWEYQKPEPQLIISDGKTLWLYRPNDRQVMIGKAPLFFGGGKGAGFLSDIQVIRNRFHISLEPSKSTDHYLLRLVPMEKTFDLKYVELYVSNRSYQVDRIVTVNTYGDETRIDLSAIRFDKVPADDLFTFTVPKGVEQLRMDQ